MSLGNDFLELIKVLWDIEEFYMWNPREHATIAYVLEKNFDKEDYKIKYDKWITLAKNKEFNEFAWCMSNEVLDIYKKDVTVDQADIDTVQKLVDWGNEFYEDKTLSTFCMVNEKYVPDWFFDLFNSYFFLEEAKRENCVVKHLMTEYNMSEQRARTSYNKLLRQDDILNEFYFYIKNNRFKNFNQIEVERYSAKQLYDTTYLEPLGAYNYLIYLRESPKEALEDLKKGLPIKF